MTTIAELQLQVKATTNTHTAQTDTVNKTVAVRAHVWKLKQLLL